MNVNELKQMMRGLGARETCRRITESLQATRNGEIGHLKPNDFSIRQLAEGLVENGRQWVQSMDPRQGGGTAVMEATSAVDSTAFSNITGQLLINAVMDAYSSPAFSISQAFETMSTNLSGEKIPGIGKISDETETVKESMPYPHVGFGEDYIETPATDKRGLIVPITKEAVFFDRTGLILERAREVGEVLGINKEKRCVDVLIGAVNNHKWKGTAYNTYQSSSPWINTLSGSTYDLLDWEQVDAAEQLFAEITDPNTGEPIVINPNTLVGCPAKMHTINRIINATEVRYTAAGGATQTLAANPLANASYRGITNRYVYSRLQSEVGLSASDAQKTWFFGDLSKAFKYMQNWPITVTQAPQNSEAEFNQDIVARFKASERGVATVWNPRFFAKISGHA
jgi:hypothetical protein